MKNLIILLSLCFTFTACQTEKNKTVVTENEQTTDSVNTMTDPTQIITEDGEFELNGTVHKTYAAFNESGTDLPVIIIIHEWWGMDDYPKDRARQLAEEGYYAMAIDVYGDGKIAVNPQEAQQLATPFYSDYEKVKNIMNMALETAHSAAQSSDEKAAALGYCFGGSFVLNAAKMGSPLDGVVSFHGGLKTVSPQPNFDTKIMVANGKADEMVTQEEIASFKAEMDSLNADYTFIEYDNATHAFTNPRATATGQKFDLPIEYNEAADLKSWKDMHNFFDMLWD